MRETNWETKRETKREINGMHPTCRNCGSYLRMPRTEYTVNYEFGPQTPPSVEKAKKKYICNINSLNNYARMLFLCMILYIHIVHTSDTFPRSGRDDSHMQCGLQRQYQVCGVL